VFFKVRETLQNSDEYADVVCCESWGCSGINHVSNSQLSAVMWNSALYRSTFMLLRTPLYLMVMRRYRNINFNTMSIPDDQISRYYHEMLTRILYV